MMAAAEPERFMIIETGGLCVLEVHEEIYTAVTKLLETRAWED